jgi:SAM-dependent methyltransferase
VGLDIGCGNGAFTRALCKAGYAVSGMDISPEMLTKAEELAAAEGIRTEFLLGDITKLKVNGKLDFAVAVNDCLNYVPPQKLGAAFSHVASCLKKGGLFHFDVSSENKLKNILGNNLFGDDGDDITYLWFNRLEEGRVEMDLTFFIRNRQGLYERREEHQTQYIHTEEALLSELERAGFAVIFHEGLWGSDDKSERIHFTCRKE